VDKEAIRALREVYRIVLRSNLLRADALALARRDFGGVPECARFLDFVASSRRGVSRHGRE
jgi:acyl-[acyl carrier protein]--UDP-N-acetylglucosamine O-acyltransferase